MLVLPRLRLLVALFALALGAGTALAQPRAPDAAARQTEPRPSAQLPALPATSVTHHSVSLPNGRSLAFTATAGALRSTDDQGVAQYDVAYVAYTLDGTDGRTRPVSFAFNGGPGTASAWLHLGVLGPWRVPMSGEANSPSAPAVMVPNAETWLDFTDLVFIDPVGTGFSQFVSTSEETRKRVWSVDGDVESVAAAIRQWTAQAGRATSPKFIVGESYGGIRGPRIVRALQTGQGIGISGLILVSPALDMGGHSSAFDPFTWVIRLPTMTATARATRGPIDRAGLADVETYVVGDYLTDLVRGDADRAATARIVARVIDFTTLDPAVVRARGGRVDNTTFVRELHRNTGETSSVYDADVRSPEPFPDSLFSSHPDPMTDALYAPFSSAMLDLYGRELKWLPDRPYHLSNVQVSRGWDYGRVRPESASALRGALGLDRNLHVLIAHGLFDLVTPYFATQLILNQFPPEIGGSRVQLVVLPGGHMFYSRDESRKAFRDAAAALYVGKQ